MSELEKQDPMRIWNEVCETDPSMAKPASNGRYSFTNIDPQWQLEKATKLWGPYGDAWGLKDLKFESLPTDPPSLMLSAVMFYPNGEGKTASFPIAIDMRLKPGDDICKKMITTARSKALSWLGFSADVYMGKFEDASYVNELKLAHADKDSVRASAMAEIAKASTREQLAQVNEKTIRHLSKKGISMELANELFAAIAKRQSEIGE